MYEDFIKESQNLEQEELSNFSDEELRLYYDSKYGWLNELNADELDEYFNPPTNEEEGYIKSSGDGQKYDDISKQSPYHPENPYYQKIFVRWDWIEIEGIISDDNYETISSLLLSKDLEKYSNQYTDIYNIVENGYYHYANHYSNFRVKISKNTDEIKVTISIASNILRDVEYKAMFKKVRTLMEQDTIKIRRIDLAFLMLMDMPDIYMGLKYSRTQSIVRNTDINRVDTVTFGTYKSNIRANLYNKKIQLEEKRKITIDAIDSLYHFELTIHGNKQNNWDVSAWREVLKERVTLSKNIINYYNPKQEKDFAYMYLFLNDKVLFKSKYNQSDVRRMQRHFKELQAKVKDEKLGLDLVPILDEILDVNKKRLADEMLELTGLSI